MLLSLAALAAGSRHSAPATGLTMAVYNNSAWAGAPLRTSVVPDFDVSLPVSSR
jgi:hypothetical protein